MAYNSAVPSASNNWSADLSAMQENFNLLRQFFMTGVAPVDGATVAYHYNSNGELDTVTFGGSLAGSATFAYTSGELRTETWSVYSATITVSHTYSSGNLTGTSIAIS